jgi:tRNA (guanosine-2'-O-)-methyltransferase
MKHQGYRTLDMRTPKRIERIRYVLERRQPDLTVVLENINDRHNFSAVLRSCDAVGILQVNAVYTQKQPFPKLSKKSSASALKWLKFRKFDSIAECYSVLRNENKKIYTTHLSKDAISLYNLNLIQPVALVFGNEHDGLSDEAVNLADGNFIIPQTGIIKSLNISVAAAVSLFEAFRQRQIAGKYNTRQLPLEQYNTLFDEWISM